MVLLVPTLLRLLLLYRVLTDSCCPLGFSRLLRLFQACVHLPVARLAAPCTGHQPARRADADKYIEAQNAVRGAFWRVTHSKTGSSRWLHARRRPSRMTRASPQTEPLRRLAWTLLLASLTASFARGIQTLRRCAKPLSLEMCNLVWTPVALCSLSAMEAGKGLEVGRNRKFTQFMEVRGKYPQQ